MFTNSALKQAEFMNFSLETALKGLMHKIYPVNHFLCHQKGPLPIQFSVPFAEYVCCMIPNTGAAVMLR